MTYQDTLTWMFSQLPMYQKEGKAAYKSDLLNTIALAEHLNNPQTKFKSVHVAGTNGKGSTSHMLAAILQAAGYKVGLYTSPHLKDFRERIKINGQVVDKNFVVDFIAKNKPFFESHALSFFEMTVGMAFQYFAQEAVDIAIVEVGMGGRLDSTNIISPEVSVITNIGLDHVQFLGNSLEKIAAEKGGIIKPNIPVVIGETQVDIVPIFKTIAYRQKADIVFADQMARVEYALDLKGRYQSKNMQTAIQTVKILQKKGFQISETAIEKGLKHVVNYTGLLGRWQVLQKAPMVICDTAHNKEGLTYVMQQLNDADFIQLHLVIGVVNDKDLGSILQLFPKNACYYFCKADIPRGLDARILSEVFSKYGLIGTVYESVEKAYQQALKRAGKKDIIFVGGSTFVVAEII